MILFLLVYTSLHAAPVTGIETLRTQYFEAAANSRHLDKFEKTVNGLSKKDQYYYCYLSALYGLKSKFSGSISKKMSYFNSCKTCLEKSFLVADSFDARFIRFCIQHNTPALLGYKDKLTEDKKYILQHLKAENSKTYKQNVKAFLMDCDLLTKKEKELVKNS